MQVTAPAPYIACILPTWTRYNIYNPNETL